MANISTYLANKLVDHFLKTASYTPATNLYVALSTADPLASGANIAEPSGNNYARVVCNVWDAAASRATANTSAIQFATASGSWGTLTHFAIFDASSGGNMLFYGALTTSRAIASGQAPFFAAGEIDISITTNKMSTYLANKLLDHALKTASYTQPTNIYGALSTANPGDSGSGIAEPVGGGYARVVQNTWNAASSGAATNNGDVDFGTTSGSWGTITHGFLADASTSGNMLSYGANGSSAVVGSGDAVSYADAAITISLS